MSDPTAILRQIEAARFVTSVHRMGDYCELHAVKLPAGEPMYISRADGDSDADVYRAAREPAASCGVEPKP
jgi:hypothetical protein